MGREGQQAFRRKLREIYLYAVRAAYWEQVRTSPASGTHNSLETPVLSVQLGSVNWQLSAGALPEGLPSMLLLQSVDEALDHSHLHGFFDWQEVQASLRESFGLVRSAFALKAALKTALR
jgi:hypothetical protein